MAKYVDACRFVPTTGGTTDWTYSSTVTGFNSPTAAGMLNGATYRYRAESANLAQWEIGTGAYNSATGVLTRSVIQYNSAGTTAAINFTVAPQVAVVAVAADLPSLSDSNIFNIGSASYSLYGTTTVVDTSTANWGFASITGNVNLLAYTLQGFRTTVRASLAGMATFQHTGNSAYNIVGVYGWVPTGGHSNAIAGMFDRPDGNGNASVHPYSISFCGNQLAGGAARAWSLYDYTSATELAYLDGDGSIHCSVLFPTNLAATNVVGSTGQGGIGYLAGGGAGGAVTQLTSKSTGVTINKICGQITTSNAALAAATTVAFTVTDSSVAALDTINVNLSSGNATAGTYQVWAEAIAAGSFKVVILNRSGGSLSEALVLNFAVFKSVIT
jgi:hypothetical protein